MISCTSDGSEAIQAESLPATKVMSYSDLAATSVSSSNTVSVDTPTSEVAGTIEIATDSASGSGDILPGPAETDSSNSHTPTDTPLPTPTVTITLSGVIETPTAVAPETSPTPHDPTRMNGILIESIAFMPDAVIEHAKEIFALGQSLGRSTRSFSKLGDSLIANPHFLTGFDTRLYNLGSYDQLQPTVERFEGSYERYGVAIHAGLHSWGIFDPMWADKNWCQPNESMVACEFRLNNPSVLLILIGSNDAGAPDSFEYNLRKLVEYSIENGVIPVLATKADRFEGPENMNNIIIREIAGDFEIPLWDFDLVADAIEGRGLKEDNVHLTPFDEFDYSMPEAFNTGHGVHNLTALMVLDAVRTQIMQLP